MGRLLLAVFDDLAFVVGAVAVGPGDGHFDGPPLSGGRSKHERVVLARSGGAGVVADLSVVGDSEQRETGGAGDELEAYVAGVVLAPVLDVEGADVTGERPGPGDADLGGLGAVAGGLLLVEFSLVAFLLEEHRPFGERVASAHLVDLVADASGLGSGVDGSHDGDGRCYPSDDRLAVHVDRRYLRRPS